MSITAPTMNDASTTATVTTSPSLGVFASQWDDIVMRQPLVSPFLRSWWLQHAAENQPLFVLVLSGETLLGGVALEEDRRLVVPRLLALGNDLAPDHVDVVADPDRVSDVQRALSSWFGRRGGRLVDFRLAPSDSLLAGALGEESAVIEGAPFTPLDADFASFLRSRPSQLRNSVERARKRLAREGVRYERHARASADQVERSLTALRALHLEVFGEGSLFFPHFDRFAAAARAGAAAGEVVFHHLTAGNDIIAIVVTFDVAGRVSYYQAGRRVDHRWRGAGGVLEAYLLEDACGRGMTEFDHLRGQEPYKVAWAPEIRPLARVSAVRGVTGRAAAAAFSLAARARER